MSNRVSAQLGYLKMLVDHSQRAGEGEVTLSTAWLERFIAEIEAPTTLRGGAVIVKAS